MCSGGELLADFQAGAQERPEVPDIVGECLTTTGDGDWVVWAHKMARPAGDRFLPLTGGDPYPVDAAAVCRYGEHLRVHVHAAPDPGCSCGFHALSQQWPYPPVPGAVALEVALSGRILAFEWPEDGVLFRAARQTVMRIGAAPEDAPSLAAMRAFARRRPEDPEGRLAMRLGQDPRGAGPVRLRLPRSLPSPVAVSEHASYCLARVRPSDRLRTDAVLVST